MLRGLGERPTGVVQRVTLTQVVVLISNRCYQAQRM